MTIWDQLVPAAMAAAGIGGPDRRWYDPVTGREYDILYFDQDWFETRCEESATVIRSMWRRSNPMDFDVASKWISKGGPWQRAWTDTGI